MSKGQALRALLKEKRHITSMPLDARRDRDFLIMARTDAVAATRYGRNTVARRRSCGHATRGGAPA